MDRISLQADSRIKGDTIWGEKKQCGQDNSDNCSSRDLKKSQMLPHSLKPARSHELTDRSKKMQLSFTH